MSTEKSTAKETLENVCWRHWGQTFDNLCSNEGNQQAGFWAPLIREAMQEYANQEVEQKTKQLNQDMDRAINLLKEVQLFHGSDPDISIDREIENFIEQLNRKQ